MQRAKEKATSAPKIGQPLPQMFPLFPLRLNKKNEDDEMRKFLFVFNIITRNFTLEEALLEMPGYPQFTKEPVTKKRNIYFKTIIVSHYCTFNLDSDMVTNNKDYGAFTIP